MRKCVGGYGDEEVSIYDYLEAVGDHVLVDEACALLRSCKLGRHVADAMEQ